MPPGRRGGNRGRGNRNSPQILHQGRSDRSHNRGHHSTPNTPRLGPYAVGGRQHLRDSPPKPSSDRNPLPRHLNGNVQPFDDQGISNEADINPVEDTPNDIEAIRILDNLTPCSPLLTSPKLRNELIQALYKCANRIALLYPESNLMDWEPSGAFEIPQPPPGFGYSWGHELPLLGLVQCTAENIKKAVVQGRSDKAGSCCGEFPAQASMR